MAVIKKFSAVKKIQKHLLGIQNLSIQEANLILDEAKNFIKLNRSAPKKLDLLRGKTQINLLDQDEIDVYLNKNKIEKKA